jgi:hypothetical protein
VGRPEGKRSLEGSRRRLEDNNKMDRKKVRWGAMNWINMDQERDRWWALVNVILNLSVPKSMRNFLTS